MTQRFCEVAFSANEGQWLEHELQDGSLQSSKDIEPADKAGGRSFPGALSLMVKWRLYQNVAEIMFNGLSAAVASSNVRITCRNAVFAGDVNLEISGNELTVILASSSAVHCLTLDISHLQVGVRIKKSETYSVTTSYPIVQCSAVATEDFGVVFSLVNEDGCLIAATALSGVFEELELKRTSLINTIWNRVRRSMISGADDGGDAASAAVSDEHPSIYCLTKSLQLQQWVIGTWECVANFNLMNYVSANHRIEGKAVKFFTYQPRSILGIQLTDGNISKIILLSVSDESGNVADCLLVADCGQSEVLTFHIMSELLIILCKSSDGQYELIHMSLNSSEPSFMKAHLKDDSMVPLELENYEDARETFTERIFGTSQLCVPALIKAITTLDPTQQISLLHSQSYSTNELKQFTWDAISNGVKNSVSSEEVTNAQYRELQTSVWLKFYNNLSQYHEASLKPLGLVYGGERLPIALVRKGCVSYIRPCEALEQQILFPSDPLDNSTEVNQEVVSIMQAVALLQNYVEGFEEHVYMSVLYGESVSEVIDQVIETINKRSEHALLKSRFTPYIQNINLFRDGISVFLHFLNMANEASQDAVTTDAEACDENPFLGMDDTALSLICSSVRDFANCRYKLCCGLLLFLEYLARLSEEVDKSDGLQTAVEEVSITCHSLLRIYALIEWISKLQASPKSDVQMSTAMLEVLKISNSDNMEEMLVPVPMKNEAQVPLLARFLSGMGGYKVKALLPSTDETSNYYAMLGQHITATCRALWPEGADVLFPEYLLANNELTSLQTYCQFLDGHCGNLASGRTFLLGQSHLLEREPEKAYSCFITALYDMFDKEVAEQDMEEEETKSQQLDFCFKVMNMFEELSYSEQVIQMAHQTLKLSEAAQSTLHTKIFKHNLELEHYDEAFKAVLTNTDPDSKMDCLHQFISTLCERGELSTLVSYPYKDMASQQDLRPAVVSILLGKARSVDLTVRNYYDLLYSFHMANNDLLSAANVMYECCERLSCELTGLAALQRKAKCYLACIHTLRCVPVKSAWIAPSSLTEYKYGLANRKSPKRTNQGRSKVKSHSKVKILMLADVEKEYMLVNMALRLASNGCKQITGCSYLDVNEIVVLLCNSGMYDEAIEVCTAYKLSMAVMFESITFRCLRMSKESETDRLSEESQEAKQWLAYNQLPTENSYSSSCDQAWKILRQYLQQHELVSTKYHKVIAGKLLANGTNLPEWFIASYKCKNVAELLRLYLQHDLIEDAVELAVEYLSALNGATYDRFGLEGSLSATMNPSSVSVPYTSIDILLNVLNEHQQDPYYYKLYTSLKEAVGQYTSDLKSKSSDVVRRLQTIRHSYGDTRMSLT